MARPASRGQAPKRIKMRIRRGDRVKVIRGNYRGQEGTVLRVDSEKNRVVVEGVNMRKRHRKPSAIDPEGGIISFEAPIAASNVMLIDPSTGEPTRVRVQLNDDGTKDRVSVKSGRAIPKA
ncbi:50S ribosomal protein L24 [soil metagenome]|jgi:large subunit ribosomal protein L24